MNKILETVVLASSLYFSGCSREFLNLVAKSSPNRPKPSDNINYGLWKMYLDTLSIKNGDINYIEMEYIKKKELDRKFKNNP